MTVFQKPNGYFPLPVNEPTYRPGEDFSPAEILHYVLSIREDPMVGGPLPAPMEFVLLPLGGLPPDAGDVFDYVKHLDLNRELGQGFIAASPYDIDVEKQLYLIIELDNRINWQFTKGAYAVTTREFYGKSNFGLHNVFPPKAGQTENRLENDDVVCRDGCRLVFFSVFSRREDHKQQKFNFHVEFLQGDKRLVVIIDPDIKNDGQSFP